MRKLKQLSIEDEIKLKLACCDEDIYKLGFECEGMLCNYSDFEAFYERLWLWVKEDGENIYTAVAADNGNGYCSVVFFNTFVREVVEFNGVAKFRIYDMGQNNFVNPSEYALTQNGLVWSFKNKESITPHYYLPGKFINFICFGLDSKVSEEERIKYTITSNNEVLDPEKYLVNCYGDITTFNGDVFLDSSEFEVKII